MVFTTAEARDYLVAWAKMATPEERQELAVRLGTWGGAWITRTVVQKYAKAARETVKRREARHRRVLKSQKRFKGG